MLLSTTTVPRGMSNLVILLLAIDTCFAVHLNLLRKEISWKMSINQPPGSPTLQYGKHGNMPQPSCLTIM